MNRNLNEAIFDTEKADALMYAIESCYLDFDILPEERERADRGIYAFYALWDAIKAVRKDLEMLAGDQRVVDAIYAANEVREKSRTLTTE